MTDYPVQRCRVYILHHNYSVFMLRNCNLVEKVLSYWFSVCFDFFKTNVRLGLYVLLLDNILLIKGHI